MSKLRVAFLLVGLVLIVTACGSDSAGSSDSSTAVPESATVYEDGSWCDADGSTGCIPGHLCKSELEEAVEALDLATEAFVEALAEEDAVELPLQLNALLKDVSKLADVLAELTEEVSR
jgi:predicted NBD/HSP70 family sugar kinase